MRSKDYLEITFWDILDILNPSNPNKNFPQPLTIVCQSDGAFVCLSVCPIITHAPMDRFAYNIVYSKLNRTL